MKVTTEREIKRGDIYYVHSVSSDSAYGSEQMANRPALIISNDVCNKYSPTVEVVYLTTKTKKDIPTHVFTRSCPRPSIILCEQIDTVSVDRLGEQCGKITKEEMKKVNQALSISLGLVKF